MTYLSMLTQEIVIQKAVNKDAYGEPSYNAQETLPARVENETKSWFDSSGRERITNTKIATTQLLTTRDRIWLPGTNTGNTAEALTPARVEKASVPSGAWSVFMTYL